MEQAGAKGEAAKGVLHVLNNCSVCGLMMCFWVTDLWENTSHQLSDMARTCCNDRYSGLFFLWPHRSWVLTTPQWGLGVWGSHLQIRWPLLLLHTCILTATEASGWWWGCVSRSVDRCEWWLCSDKGVNMEWDMECWSHVEWTACSTPDYQSADILPLRTAYLCMSACRLSYTFLTQSNGWGYNGNAYWQLKEFQSNSNII